MLKITNNLWAGIIALKLNTVAENVRNMLKSAKFRQNSSNIYIQRGICKMSFYEVSSCFDGKDHRGISKCPKPAGRQNPFTLRIRSV